MNTIINPDGRLERKTEDLVFLDHEFPSAYPEYAKLNVFPKREEPSVTGFDINEMEPWFHGNAIKEYANGEIILEYLRDHILFDDCIGLPELGGIYAKGDAFFREHFGDKAVFAWQAVLKIPRGRYVPYLIDFAGHVILCLHWMGGICKENFIALRHTENSRIYTTQQEEAGIKASNVFVLGAKKS